MPDPVTRDEIDLKAALGEAKATAAYQAYAAKVDAQIEAQRLISAERDASSRAMMAEFREALRVDLDAMRAVSAERHAADRALMAEFRDEVRKEVEGLQADGNSTRNTILVTAIATILTIAGLAYSLYSMNLTAQQNLLSAFQTGIAAQLKPAEGKPSSSFYEWLNQINPPIAGTGDRPRNPDGSPIPNPG